MLLEIIHWIAEGLPLYRAAEDSGLNLFTADLRAALPQPTKEK